MKTILCLFLTWLLWSNVMPASSFNKIAVASDISNKPTKLLFIHHSVGGHWLAHDYGGLVSELNKKNIYVNDITYEWEPPELNTMPKKTIRFLGKVKHKLLNSENTESGAYGIGNRTDIGQMYDWFLGPDSELIMGAVYRENLETTTFGDHSNSSSAIPLANPDPLAENQIIMFKSCYPNTLLKGNPDDPPTQGDHPPLNFSAGSDEHTVANAKRIFNDLLIYFGNHPDKFFVIVTPPPRLQLPENGKIARGFCNWLVSDWLKENNYKTRNVMVFDLFNVLTSGVNTTKNDAGEEQGNHHRLWKGKVQHVVQSDNNLLVYPRAADDNHPAPAGLRKASEEFVPLLNHYYSLWYARDKQ